ncbi:hypothetical protein [Aquamicrobium zhengzhouense]|nr:hypothetical protein [Aquamicrobium zhengzhouense]
MIEEKRRPTPFDPNEEIWIKNMQIVNHVRSDGWQIHAIFNTERWGGWPCQLTSHVDGGGYIVKAMWCPNERGICSFTDLNEQITEAAASAYDDAMIEVFGEDWFKIEDGRTRVMEWKSRKAE